LKFNIIFLIFLSASQQSEELNWEKH